MYLHEGMHRVLMAKEVIWRYVITGIVMEWVIKQQCHERAMMGDLFKEDKAPGVRLLYGNNMVVWDTGQRTHRAQPAKVEQNMIDQSAFFGWCTDVRGTNAGVDAMELIEYESQKFLSQSSQCFRQQQAGQNHNQQHEERDHQGEPAGQSSQHKHQVGHVHQHLRHPHLLQAGRPPEGSSGFENKYDDIGLKISFRNRFEQNTSVLDGGGASLVVRCRLQEEPNKVYCRVTFRYLTWNEVQARTDTLVGQPPYLETRGWKEVVPFGD